MNSFPKLFIPGPTHVPEDVMQSLTSPQIGHRTPEFSELMSTIVEGIQKVLYTKNKILLTSNPATALWEMGILNSVSKGINQNKHVTPIIRLMVTKLGTSCLIIDMKYASLIYNVK